MHSFVQQLPISTSCAHYKWQTQFAIEFSIGCIPNKPSKAPRMVNNNMKIKNIEA